MIPLQISTVETIITNRMKDVDGGVPICYEKRLCSLELSHRRGCHLSCRRWSTPLRTADFRSGRHVSNSAPSRRGGRPAAVQLMRLQKGATTSPWPEKLRLRAEQHDYCCIGIGLKRLSKELESHHGGTVLQKGYNFKVAKIAIIISKLQDLINDL